MDSATYFVIFAHFASYNCNVRDDITDTFEDG